MMRMIRTRHGTMSRDSHHVVRTLRNDMFSSAPIPAESFERIAMRHQVRTNGDLAAIHAAGMGYVFNWYTTGPTAAQYSLLHAASCRTLPQMLAAGRPDDAPCRKYFFANVADAQSWLSENVGAEGQHWSRCRVCQGSSASAAVAVHAVRSSASDPAPVISAQTPETSAGRAYFTKPDGPRLQLRVKPELESFERRESASQRRLQHYLDDTVALLRAHYGGLGSAAPLALRLDVGLPGDRNLLNDRDLDNYLAPLARRLNDDLPGRIVTAWATKQRADCSYIRLAHAIAAPPGAMPPGDLYFVETTASSGTEKFKGQIADRLSAAAQLPYGPLRMQISFIVGPSRNWINLWKPTIDALVHLLGRDPNGATNWSPLDGRITDLAFHLKVDRAIGNKVQIALASELIQPTHAETHYRVRLLRHGNLQCCARHHAIIDHDTGLG